MSDDFELQEPGRTSSVSAPPERTAAPVAPPRPPTLPNGMQVFGPGAGACEAPVRTSKLAIGSLVLSLLCALFPLAFILSIVALVRCKRSGGQLKGTALAVVGLCVSVLSIVGLSIGASLFAPAFLGARNKACEAAAIASLKALAPAQETYRGEDHDGDNILEYAQSVSELAEAGLIEGAYATADASAAQPKAKAGYLYRILTGNGPQAPGGQKNFLVRGNLQLGYAIVAYPVQHGISGKHTFVVFPSGNIILRDLGPDTAQIVGEWQTADIDPNWLMLQ